MTTSDQLNPPACDQKWREAELNTKLNKKENSINLFNSKTKLHFHHKWIMCSKWPPGNWSIITKLSGKSSFLSLFSIHLPHVLFFIWIYIQMNINSIKKNLLILLLLFLLQFCGKMTDLKEIIGLLIVVKRNFCVWKLRSLFENNATLKGGRGLLDFVVTSIFAREKPYKFRYKWGGDPKIENFYLFPTKPTTTTTFLSFKNHCQTTHT